MEVHRRFSKAMTDTDIKDILKLFLARNLM
jgi:hypothetical protein